MIQQANTNFWYDLTSFLASTNLWYDLASYCSHLWYGIESAIAVDTKGQFMHYFSSVVALML